MMRRPSTSVSQMPSHEASALKQGVDSDWCRKTSASASSSARVRPLHVRRLEGAAQRRQVDVALGGTAIGGGSGLVHRSRASPHHQGSEYVLVLVKLFIASCTPSL